MNRREALASLTALAGATGMTVTPLTAKDAEAVTLVIFKIDRPISMEQSERFRQWWGQACVGTDLEHVKSVVLSDGIEVEFVRGSR